MVCRKRVFSFGYVKRALEAKELEYQTLFRLPVEGSMLRREFSPLRDSVETLSRRKTKIVMVSQDVEYLATHPKKIPADAEALKKWDVELVDEAEKEVKQAIVKSTWSKAELKKLDGVKSKLAASSV